MPLDPPPNRQHAVAAAGDPCLEARLGRRKPDTTGVFFMKLRIGIIAFISMLTFCAGCKGTESQENHGMTFGPWSVSSELPMTVWIKKIAEGDWDDWDPVGTTPGTIDIPACMDRTFWLDVHFGRAPESYVRELNRLGVKRVHLPDNTTDKSVMILCDGCPQLESLDLTYTKKLTNKAMASIGRLKQLRVLHIRNTPSITDEGVGELSGLSHLESLKLDGCKKLTDASAPAIAQLKNLRILDLSSTQVSDVGITQLSALPKLEVLTLFQVGLTDEGVSAIAKLRNLRVLTLGGCSDAGFTGKTLGDLSVLPRFRSLYLGGCGSLTYESMPAIAALKELRSLNLGGTGIIDESLGELAALNKLESLDLSDCNHLTDKAIGAIIQLKSLKALDLDNCEFTDAGVERLSALRKLESLTLCMCRKLTGKIIPILTRKLPNTDISFPLSAQ
jgi:hypothetical protein